MKKLVTSILLLGSLGAQASISTVNHGGDRYNYYSYHRGGQDQQIAFLGPASLSSKIDISSLMLGRTCRRLKRTVRDWPSEVPVELNDFEMFKRNFVLAESVDNSTLNFTNLVLFESTQSNSDLEAAIRENFTESTGHEVNVAVNASSETRYQLANFTLRAGGIIASYPRALKAALQQKWEERALNGHIQMDESDIDMLCDLRNGHAELSLRMTVNQGRRVVARNSLSRSSMTRFVQALEEVKRQEDAAQSGTFSKGMILGKALAKSDLARSSSLFRGRRGKQQLNRFLADFINSQGEFVRINANFIRSLGRRYQNTRTRRGERFVRVIKQRVVNL